MDDIPAGVKVMVSLIVKSFAPHGVVGVLVVGFIFPLPS
jgi:hypothetical protein